MATAQLLRSAFDTGSAPLIRDVVKCVQRAHAERMSRDIVRMQESLGAMTACDAAEYCERFVPRLRSNTVNDDDIADHVTQKLAPSEREELAANLRRVIREHRSALESTRNIRPDDPEQSRRQTS